MYITNGMLSAHDNKHPQGPQHYFIGCGFFLKIFATEYLDTKINTTTSQK